MPTVGPQRIRLIQLITWVQLSTGSVRLWVRTIVLLLWPLVVRVGAWGNIWKQNDGVMCCTDSEVWCSQHCGPVIGHETGSDNGVVFGKYVGNALALKGTDWTRWQMIGIVSGMQNSSVFPHFALFLSFGSLFVGLWEQAVCRGLEGPSYNRPVHSHSCKSSWIKSQWPGRTEILLLS